MHYLLPLYLIGRPLLTAYAPYWALDLLPITCIAVCYCNYRMCTQQYSERAGQYVMAMLQQLRAAVDSPGGPQSRLCVIADVPAEASPQSMRSVLQAAMCAFNHERTMLGWCVSHVGRCDLTHGASLRVTEVSGRVVLDRGCYCAGPAEVYSLIFGLGPSHVSLKQEITGHTLAGPRSHPGTFSDNWLWQHKAFALTAACPTEPYDGHDHQDKLFFYGAG